MSGWLAAGFVVTVWGMTFASTRVLLVDFSALEILFLRFALACAALLAMSGRLHWRGWRNEALCMAMGITGVFAYQLLENCAIYYTNASNVAILVSFSPILTAILSRVFTHDRSLTPSMVFGSVMALIGVVMVSMNGVRQLNLRPLGDAMAVLAMFCWAAYSILVGRANARGIPAQESICKAFSWSLVMMMPFMVWGVTPSGRAVMDGSLGVCLDPASNCRRFADLANLGHLVFLGVVSSAWCFALWSVACRRLGVVRTSVGIYLIPVVGAAFAAFFLGERVTPTGMLGGAMIICGAVFAGRR